MVFPGVLRGLRDLDSRPPPRNRPRRSLSSPWDVSLHQCSPPADTPSTSTRRRGRRGCRRSGRGVIPSFSATRSERAFAGSTTATISACRPAEPERQRGARRLGGDAPPPRRPRQPPADLDRGQHVGQEHRHRQAAEAQQRPAPVVCATRPPRGRSRAGPTRARSGRPARRSARGRGAPEPIQRMTSASALIAANGSAVLGAPAAEHEALGVDGGGGHAPTIKIDAGPVHVRGPARSRAPRGCG